MGQSFLNLIIRADNIELLLMYENRLLERRQLVEYKLECVRSNSIHCLKLLHAWCSRWHKDSCQVALESGALECLIYAYENSCPMRGSIYESAIKGGHVDCLEYLDAKFPHTDIYFYGCRYAVIYGQLECLKYAHRRGYAWSEITCQLAARHGHLSCLKYAHENGCRWDQLTCKDAFMYGHHDCLEYALANGCPWF